MEFLANVILDGVEYNYHVTRDGRVFSLKYGKVKELKLCSSGNGYNMVRLCHNGISKLVLVSRLVALAYIPNPDNKPTVDHINRVRTDNRVENLRWANRIEQNYNRGKINYPKNIKGSKPVRCIDTGIIYPSIMEIYRQFGFSYGNISQCCNGKRKSAYGFHWEYVE